MTDDLEDKLDTLIDIGERIASALEFMEQEQLTDMASSLLCISEDVSSSDGYAHSMKLDLESIRSTVDSIHLEIL
ncbi:MAG: hypothetical protein ACR2MB_15805 [Acidimicrobiales bacterium]